jgi:ATP-dependent exoDNAse (exonuclease V) beta subunit
LDPFAGLYLEAPADFRRTFLLIARFLRLLSIGDQPGQILALTFTNKPAGEMRKTVPDDDIEQAVSWSVLRRWTPICVEAARVV